MADSKLGRGSRLSAATRRYADTPKRRYVYSTPMQFSVKERAMRKVLRSAQGPQEIPPQEKSVWICMCGLSKNQPFSHRSHKHTPHPPDANLYVYDEQAH